MDDVDLNKKSVLLRVDLNSAIVDGKIELSDRMIAHADTIRELTRKKAKVVVLAHQGRKGSEDFTSLKQHAKMLNKLVRVKYIDDIIGERAVNAIKQLEYGEALLLENVRGLQEEEDGGKNNKFVKTLAPYFDYYINDAFSVSHRKQTSVTGFPQVLPGLVGRVMQAEIGGADKLHLDDVLFVLGGAKPEEHIDLLKSRKKADVIAAGLFGLACLAAKGYKLGKQDEILRELNIKVDKNFVKKYMIYTPVDLVALINGKRHEIKVSELPCEYDLLDIGSRTIERYKDKIMKAKVVLMKGPAGKYEDRKFINGTKELLDAMVETQAYTIVAGGNTLSAMKYLNIKKKDIDHVSLAGGAFIEYMAGNKLPGLEALKKR